MATYNINKIQLPNGDICNTSTEIVRLSSDSSSNISNPYSWNLPAGGTAGQVLKKASSTDYDVEWTNEFGLIAGSSTWTLPAFSLDAFSGSKLSNILNDYAVDVPNGYSLLANVDVSISGVLGLVCFFDGAQSQYDKITPNIFLYNARNATVNVSNNQAYINVVSLFIKN